jgi:hypothetical protein
MPVLETVGLFIWPPGTSHTLEPTPLSEIFHLRIQGYSCPCLKLRDTCYISFLSTILELSTRRLSASKGRPVPNADLTAICESTV